MINVTSFTVTRFKKMLFFALAVLFAASAMAAGLSGSVYTAGTGRYLWRGQLLSDGPALQPGFTLNFNKLSLGYWGSFHAFGGGAKYNESDYTLSFADSVPYLDFLSLKGGFTAYTFPYSAPNANNTTEIFAAISSGSPLSPYAAFYYDTMLGAGGYAEAGISHSVSLGDFSFSGALTGGYNFGQWGYEKSLTVLGITASVSYAIAGVKITPSAFCQVSLDSQYMSFGTGSITLNYDFTL
jgi:hypothetical protein